MFFMARATDPTLPGLLGRSSTTSRREKRSVNISQKIPRYVDVAVPLPVRSLFTYRVPESLAPCALPGARAVVPVGRRVVTGVIVAATEEPPPGAAIDPSRIRGVRELPDAAPI